jgi:hypothetical protein
MRYSPSCLALTREVLCNSCSALVRLCYWQFAQTPSLPLQVGRPEGGNPVIKKASELHVFGTVAHVSLADSVPAGCIMPGPYLAAGCGPADRVVCCRVADEGEDIPKNEKVPTGK